MADEKQLTELAMPWAAVMPDGDLHEFLGDLVAAAMNRWRSDPDVPDREVLAMVERACAQWRTPGLGFRSDEGVDPRLEEIRAREQAASKGPWIADGAELFQGEGDIPAFWGTWIGETLNIDDDAASNANAQFAAHARTDIPWLVAELTESRTKLEIAERRNKELAERLAKYEGHEPTVDEELAYLNRCLNAVQDVCDKAESTATRWEQPLPVPEWVTVVRAAATGSVTEEEPAGVPW